MDGGDKPLDGKERGESLFSGRNRYRRKEWVEAILLITPE